MVIKDGLDMNAKNSKTGKSLNAIRRNVRLSESVLRTYTEKIQMGSHQKRLSNEQLKARLIVFIGVALALTFMFSVAGMLYALIRGILSPGAFSVSAKVMPVDKGWNTVAPPFLPLRRS